jgi:hypothetical protein
MNNQDQIREMAKAAELEKQNKYKNEVVEFNTSIIAKSYEKALAYTNLIIFAGYVLFFSFWKEVRGELDKVWSGISVILVIISLIFFIAWEIFQMIQSSAYFRKLYSTFKLSPDNYSEKIQNFNKEIQKNQARVASLWIFELIFTIIPGFLGAGILLFLYSQNLINDLCR